MYEILMQPSLTFQVWSVLKGRSRKLVKTLEITVTQPPGKDLTCQERQTVEIFLLRN